MQWQPSNDIHQIILAPASGTTALVGGTVMTAAGQRYEGGVVVLHNGKIQAVGDSATTIPAGAKKIDVSGLAAGVYFLRIHTDEGIAVKKFIRM